MSDAHEKLRNQHSHHTPNKEGADLFHSIRQRVLDLAIFIEDKIPNGRDKALAQTKLDECRMWMCSATAMSMPISDNLVINNPL